MQVPLDACFKELNGQIFSGRMNYDMLASLTIHCLRTWDGSNTSGPCFITGIAKTGLTVELLSKLVCYCSI
jgi:hypothetical protein